MAFFLTYFCHVMQNFRTELKILPSSFVITHQSNVMTIGSCFSDTIGNTLRDNKFPVCINPFGTVFNPVSIGRLMDYVINNELPDENSFIENDGLISNYHFHSSFSNLDYDLVKKNIAEALLSTRLFLQSSNYLFITLGTAWVYNRTDTNVVVSNCHKMPANNFSKKLLSLEEISEALQTFITRILHFRKDLKIIFTLSPVRHIKDTLEGNMISKSLLRTAIHNLVVSNQELDYFPAYEIMIDDLRDYRFYEKDMLHPNDQAQQYLWQKFSDRYFDHNTLSILSEWRGIKKSLSHRPANINSSHYLTFLNQTLERLVTLNKKINVNQEIDKIKEDLRLLSPPA